jgi:Uncharacterized conserved protein
MYAANFGQITIDDSEIEAIDTGIRERIPTGYDVHNSTDYHMIDDFPWDECEEKIQKLNFETEFSVTPEYDDSYIADVCDKVDYDTTRAINSMGTLGGGNHFIELGYDETDNVWAVIHSGSRGIGAAIAQYWQDKATNLTTRRQSLDDVPEDIVEYMNENWKPKADKIRADFSGEAIQQKFDEVSQAIAEYGPSKNSRNTDLDYLEADEAHRYIKDMAFAQTYASESRKEMMINVAAAIHERFGEISGMPKLPVETIESVHNYIDYEDATIRKGACKASNNNRLIVPLNMNHGSVIAVGKSDDEWNNSSAHGAGRRMSRREAKRRYDDDDFDSQIENVFMSEQPLDEIPASYKNPDDIETAISDTAQIINRITPFLSVKAP